MTRARVALAVLALLAACGPPRSPRAPAGVGRRVAVYMPGPDDGPASGGFTGVLRALERPDDADADGGSAADRAVRAGLDRGLASDASGWPSAEAAGEARGVALVDDRRWLEVPADGQVAIDGLAPTLVLDSLVLEPLEGGELAVVWCTRAPAPAPAAPIAVRCQLRGVAGRHLVRVAYAAGGVAWQASHRITARLDASGRGTAQIQSTFAIAAPGWPADATDLELWRGLPDGPASPTQVWAGRAPLAAAVTVPGATAPREVRARTLAIFRGAVRAGGLPPTDPAWNEHSRTDVQAWLLVDAALPGGQAEVELVGAAGSQIAIGAVEPGAAELWGPGLVCAGRPTGSAPDPDCADLRGSAGTRVPLWPDPRWRGRRDVHRISSAEDTLRERVRLRVDNLGDQPAEIWIEEPLRDARRHRVEALGRTPHDRGGWLRTWFRVDPKRRAQAGFALAYDF